MFNANELFNQRVIWQIITQAFFFSAYTSLLNAQKEAKTPMFEAEQLLLLWLLPIAGLLAGALTYVSIIDSLKTIEHLRSLYEEFSSQKPLKITAVNGIHISRVLRISPNGLN